VEKEKKSDVDICYYTIWQPRYRVVRNENFN